MFDRRRVLLALGGLLIAGAFATATAWAASTVTVTPNNLHGWSTADTRPGGAVNFIADPTSPLPGGALQLTTTNSTAAKAQFMHAANTPLSKVTQLGYSTEQTNGPTFADPSYQLLVELDGTAASFTTFVYEPYENGTVAPATWQTWDVATGQFWSTHTYTSGGCSVVNGAGGPPYYTLAVLKAACPNAVVVGFGVNIGSNNPGYTVETDAVNFNGTTYDFQVVNTPRTEDQCTNGGYANFTNDNGQNFKNQGQCVAYVRSHDQGDHGNDNGGNDNGGNDQGGRGGDQGDN
jgi:hypothetical protein